MKTILVTYRFQAGNADELVNTVLDLDLESGIMPVVIAEQTDLLPAENPLTENQITKISREIFNQ